MGEERLQDSEPLGSDGARDSVALSIRVTLDRLGSRLDRLARVPVADPAQALRRLAPEVVGLDGHRPSILAQHPRREQRKARVLGDEDSIPYAPGLPVQTLDPPGRVTADLDARFADDVADLPGGPRPVLVHVEILRRPEVALAPGREADLSADA